MSHFRLLLAVIGASLLFGHSSVLAQPEHIVRAEAGVGLIMPPQAERFQNPGFALGLGYELRLLHRLGLELRYNFLGWAAKDEDSFGLTHNLGIGARVYLLPNDDSGRLWLGAGPALAFTGGEARFALQAGLGYEFAPTEHLLVGPMLRMTWIIEPAGGALQSRDAVFLQLGVSVAYTTGSGAPEGPVDTDGDGVTDDADACPTEPEDRDGFQDDDGCPDDDNDSDGIPDDADACPSEAETLNGHEDEDGCPDTLPETDSDGDGISDANDACPDSPEDHDGFEDTDGCPELDNDGDGIADADDQCPLQPETANGLEDEDGCPDELPRVSIDERLLFAVGSTNLTGAAHRSLRQVVEVLRAHPEARVRVDGYADHLGEAADNQRLSEARAETVRRALVRAGIAAERIDVVGYGETRADGDDRTESPDSRRVEFHVE